MRKIIDICKLIRLPYLFAATYIMFATRELILSPILAINNHHVQLSLFKFAIICLSTLLLIAAGYIINDYFDTKDDRIIRPKDIIVGRKITRISAIKLHSILNVLAIILAIYVSYSISYTKLSIFFVLASGLLWFYSTSYKRYNILGKIVISCMIAAMPIVVVLFEIPLLSIKYSAFLQETGIGFSYLLDWTGALSILLFFSSLIINLTKDSIKGMILEDKPISLSVKITLSISYIALIVFILFLGIRIFDLALFARYYLLAVVMLPALFSLYRLLSNASLLVLKTNYNLSKIIFLGILMFCLFIPYIINNKLL